MQLYDTARRRRVRPRGRAASSRCTAVASRPTTRRTWATPSSTSPLTCCNAVCIDAGHEMRCVRNVTDVDDDMLRKARELGVNYLDLAAQEMAKFERDMKLINLLPVYSEPRATGAIPEILTHDRCARSRAGSPTRSTARSTSRSSKFPRFGQVSHEDRARDVGARGDARRAARRPAQARSAGLRACGSHRWRTSRRGSRAGGRVARVGTSSVRRSRCAISARPSTCTAGARPRVSPPRVRGGPERDGHRRAIREALDARRTRRPRRDQDEQVAWQPRLRARAGRAF